MPELPEMETYKSLLTQTVVGMPVLSAEIRRQRTINIAPDQFVQQVTGRQITHVRRRAKHIVFHLDAPYVLVVHLMLGGWMYYGSTEDVPKHESQVILSFANGRKLYFQGLRLGYLHLLTYAQLEEKFKDLGPEPFEQIFTEAVFQQVLRRKRGVLKAALVDQHCIAGIGNCYSDEICHEAGVLPLRRVHDIQPETIAALHRAMHAVLERAISFGGYMEFPFFQGDEFTGRYNDQCLVYDRGNEPCLRCGHLII
ncbi:endonuclease VIII [Alicyclobacillus fastidiosus]|uniref:Endonuclease VIII n=1 Tax=Alicyclobacillus fastidiosus TaxID=392011 RepID=A0ABY6ZGE9_9BACL|nr:DNA-formamidopyrimidine glycosylase family protein [Alicyclobacillus fastidiosus]WAH41911.1 endonuclease VIII [Alicyclobacillus fastidiosus]GMA63626.1 DNA-formamidopyrimidine glycosylase [Alicyclobacillus fastidiosus]